MKVRELKEQYFSFKGRVNRKPFMYRLLVIGGLSIFFLLYIITIEPHLKEDLPNFTQNLRRQLIFWVFYIPLAISSLSIGIRRLHDLNRSEWWIFLSLLPMVGSYIPQSEDTILTITAFNYIGQMFNLYLLLAKGTNGPNKYGEDPLIPFYEAKKKHEEEQAAIQARRKRKIAERETAKNAVNNEAPLEFEPIDYSEYEEYERKQQEKEAAEAAAKENKH